MFIDSPLSKVNVSFFSFQINKIVRIFLKGKRAEARRRVRRKHCSTAIKGKESRCKSRVERGSSIHPKKVAEQESGQKEERYSPEISAEHEKRSKGSVLFTRNQC
ncbi:hypothetical protein AZF04_10815 [Alkalihalobacillus trypoxylicola]|uniref:Uncharacterized protein n=1 Tax=Alkalihalobacillus trypoxylicola TaxID=519424 RepID=A0A161PYM7_9BACI|nr:hypothetical protein AZF04_10815 [Alkalihalobacillus trypoxylicola]